MFKNKLDRVIGEELNLRVTLPKAHDSSDEVPVTSIELNGKRYIREDLIEDKTEESPISLDGSYVQVMQNENATTIITKDFTLIRHKEGRMWIVDKHGIRLSKDGALMEIEQCVDEDGSLYAGRAMYDR
ncbi:hypothetical protein [Listeria newyorkensis]|uniref:Uncharacterized protein n=1 Tax=Listeria newyorkensis TaxID=1497681 RepID=A0A841Z067_9LIST|nr:hypothetical protein [Listeria newyorkensis]MBC1459060.1 hypothetical protein [Listeria newyorkensis]